MFEMFDQLFIKYNATAYLDKKNQERKEDFIIESEKTNNSFCIPKFPIFDPSKRGRYIILCMSY